MRISQKNENRIRKKNCQSPPPYRAQATNGLKKTFPKSARILKHSHYKELAKNSRRFVGNFVTMEYRLGKVSHPKLGITISKRFGKAHLRNLFKRRIREVFRVYQNWLYPDLELNIYPRGPILLPTIQEIAADFLQFSQELSHEQP